MGLSPKIRLKKKTITKDLLQQSYKVHPHGYSPAGLVRLPTR